MVEDCGAPCSEKLFFGLPNVYQMRLWVGIWAVVCLASTLFTLLTFLVDSGRFPYPEKVQSMMLSDKSQVTWDSDSLS